MKKHITLILLTLSTLFAYPDLLFHAIGDNNNSVFGVGIAGVGDQNNDGFDDVLIRDATSAYLFLGGDPMDTTSDWNFGYNPAPVNIGDVNGDDIIDFMFWGNLFFGGMPYDTIPNIVYPRHYQDEHLLVYKTVGDINNDNYNDIIGYWRSNITYGYVALYYGGPEMDSIPEFTWRGATSNTKLRIGSYAPGYFNSDFVHDLFIRRGQYFSDTVMHQIHLGPEIGSEPDTVFGEIVSQDSLYTYSTYYRDDFNGDGYPEIYMPQIPVPNHIDTIFYYINGGPGYNPENIYCTLDIPFGFSISHVVFPGDVNGDGYNDLLYGSIWSWVPFGGILLYLGGPEMGPYPTFEWVGSYSGEPYPYLGTGYALSWCGDVNGDGINDIMFSAVTDEWNENHRGQVYIYAGDSTWVNPSVAIDPEPSLPKEFTLDEPYPNPFNSVVTIPYELKKEADISLKIYSIQGRWIETLHDGKNSPGKHTINWDAKGHSSGVYFIRLKSHGTEITKKVIYLK